jgi:hypothetical protein
MEYDSGPMNTVNQDLFEKAKEYALDYMQTIGECGGIFRLPWRQNGLLRPGIKTREQAK